MAEMKPWGSGDPDKRIAIYKPSPTATADIYHHVDLSDAANWSLVANRFARVLNTAAGREPNVGDQVIAIENFQVWFRWEPNLPISPLWRIQFGTRIWQIIAAANWGEKNQWFKLVCCEERT